MQTKRTTGIPSRPCRRCGSVFSPSNNADPGYFCSRACYMITRHERALETREQRFWSYVDKTDGCWLWLRSTAGKGYGQFVIGHGRAIMSHRMAWMFATGETLTPDEMIGHVCDIPRCVRNDGEGFYEVAGVLLPRRGHLFKGTLIDNNADMSAKGRRRSNRKIPWGAEAEIRELYAQGHLSQDAVGALYGISQAAISLIVLGKSKH